MKLVIREYLASLRERDELDAILPDLLSELGFTVFSRPGKRHRSNLGLMSLPWVTIQPVVARSFSWPSKAVI